MVASCATATQPAVEVPQRHAMSTPPTSSARRPAANDMASIIKALGISKIDLYGDSYGSFFAQTFASRYPG